jgi:hypothetical protein
MRHIMASFVCLLAVSMAAGQSTDRSLLEWRQNAATGDQWNLFRRQHCIGKYCFPEKQLGAYTPADRSYRELLDSGEWSTPKQPPIAPPASPAGNAGDVGDVTNYGVVNSKRSSRDKATYKGVEITMADANNLAGGQVDESGLEDGKKHPLTIIAKDAATYKRIMADMATAEAEPLTSRYRVQVYDLSRDVDRQILAPFKVENDPRFAKGGTVCYLQEASDASPSRVVCAVGDWDGPGPVVSAVRRADPGWDPSKVSVPGIGGDLFGSVKSWVMNNQGQALILAASLAYLAFAKGYGSKAADGLRVVLRPWMTPAAPPATPMPSPVVVPQPPATPVVVQPSAPPAR